MTPPLVSICLPNLNTYPYLQERIDTILQQTYSNWELIVVDGYSTDGSWEFFQSLAEREARVTLTQAPRGLYAAWNRCIERARGEYIYIATSDDTMAVDCIEMLVEALEEHKECDIAHCPLVLIDEGGVLLPSPAWRSNAPFSAVVSGIEDRKHIRLAPLDGLLHLTGLMVFQSITELLVRRSLFTRIGGFTDKWGSVGDLYWEMKAGLVANTVHVPGTWVSWRIYPEQETNSVGFFSPEHYQKVEEMLRSAVDECRGLLPPRVASRLEHLFSFCADMRHYYQGLRARPDAWSRRCFQLAELRGASVRHELAQRVAGKVRWPDRAASEIRAWLESIVGGPVLLPVASCSSTDSSGGAVAL